MLEGKGGGPSLGMGSVEPGHLVGSKAGISLPEVPRRQWG